MRFTKILTFLISLAILLILTGRADAQVDAMFTQYMNNETFINPAYTGSKEALAVTLLHRQQWVGYSGRPVITTFAAHTPLIRDEMGVGVCYLNEKIGVMNRNLLYAGYAYRFRVAPGSFVGLGLMGGVHLQQNNVSKLNTVNPDDPRFSADIPMVATPNFGFGIYYNTHTFYAGFSVPRLLDDHIERSGEGFHIKSVRFDIRSLHLYFTAGRVFSVNRNFILKPHLMMKAVANAPVQFDANLNVLLLEKLWAGISYRSNTDIGILAGVYITPTLLLSYSYDYPTTGMQKFSGGTHEIVLGYVFAYGGKKINTPRYF
jgi:type IX secretion system PorP/SprF family membrane protein